MNRNLKFAALLGAAVLVGGSTLAFAHMDGPMPPDGPLQGLVHRDRLGERLLQEFDTDKDGKITRAEFNGIIAARFSAATHGAKEMTAEQFAAIHMGDFQKHAAGMFRRLDWNGDGKLTLDEFEAPQRAHFQMLDRDGSGTVDCAPMHADFRPDAPPPPDAPSGADENRGGRQGGWRHGPHGFQRGDRDGYDRASFCFDADASRDGKVTRAEFEQIMVKKFQAATGGAPAMTLAQFTATMAGRYRDTNDRMFQRLDVDDKGKITLAQFAAPELRLFDRLDRNHDGILTADEMAPRFGDDWHHRDRHDDRGPRDDGRNY